MNRRAGLFQSISFLLSAFVLVGCNESASSERPRYNLQVDQGGNAWRIDILTGETLRCWQGTAGVVAPQCFKANVPASTILYVEGKLYVDANGNKARYVNGSWVPVGK